MTAPRFEIELDDDGYWTVWEEGEHVAMCLTRQEARDWVRDVKAVEAIDRALFGEDR